MFAKIYRKAGWWVLITRAGIPRGDLGAYPPAELGKWYSGTSCSILWSGAFPPGGWIGFTVHEYQLPYCLCKDTTFIFWMHINILIKKTIWFTVHGYHFPYCLCMDTTFSIWTDININKKNNCIRVFHRGTMVLLSMNFLNQNSKIHFARIFYSGEMNYLVRVQEILWHTHSLFITIISEYHLPWPPNLELIWY